MEYVAIFVRILLEVPWKFARKHPEKLAKPYLTLSSKITISIQVNFLFIIGLGYLKLTEKFNKSFV